MTLSRATEPSIFIRHGIRSISPYYTEYKTPFKERWRGKSVPHILQTELGQTEASVRSSIETGHIYVTANNGKSGQPLMIEGNSVYTHLLKNHDIIHNVQHCHEPSIRVPIEEATANTDNDIGTRKTLSLDAGEHSISSKIIQILNEKSSFRLDRKSRLSQYSCLSTLVEKHDIHSTLETNTTNSGIDILFNNTDLLIANKPGGVPTHPGGIYRYNTLSEILSHDLNYKVWPCHRLDKSTSGVILFAKTKETCTKYMRFFQEKDGVEKWYLAKVNGKFIYNACVYRCPVFSVNTAGNAYINVSNLKQVPTNSATQFYMVNYDSTSNTSIILCRPITGRMHQIRIHLRNLGFPIANDDLYNGESTASIFKNEVELSIYRNIWSKFPDFAAPTELAPSILEGTLEADSEVAPLVRDVSKNNLHTLAPTICLTDFFDEKTKTSMNSLQQVREKKDKIKISGVCAECNGPLYSESSGPDSGIWLHALALQWDQAGPLFQGPQLAVAPLPAWCT